MISSDRGVNMKKMKAFPILALLLLPFALPIACRADSATHFISPQGKIELFFKLQDGQPTYRLNFRGKAVLDEGALGLKFWRAPSMKAFALRNITHRSHDSTYELPLGKSRFARDQYEEYTFALQEKTGHQRQLSVIFRLYDDGIGFRYVLPAQPKLTDFKISRELTSFRFVGNPELFALEPPLKSTFEGYYTRAKIQEFRAGSTMNLPVLTGDKDSPWVAVTEAALTDYAGLNLARTKGSTLEARLTPSEKNPAVTVSGRAPFASPWRVVMVGESAGALLESNIVNNLNEPTQIPDLSWIRPGKVQFPWWSDYRLPVDSQDPDPTHRAGLNTYSLKRYIDFCAQNGIEYHSIDGFNQAWYGGEIGEPSKNVDLTKSIPEIDLPEVLRYGKSKGVKTRLWMHRKALERTKNIAALFSLYEKWGIEGIMVDFLNSDDQETVRFYTKVIQLAAQHKLTVNFHGSWKPTGVSRTYPNLLSHEGVMSSEYNRFNEKGSPPEHEMIYAFVRMLAGPADVHPGSFNPIPAAEWTPENGALRAMGTLARQLAFYVVIESGSQMVVDSPDAYAAHPRAFQFIREVPVSWDETKVLAGEVGEYISVARRKGSEWFVGTMTNRAPVRLELPLRFLGSGNFIAEIYADGENAQTIPTEIKITKLEVTSNQTISAILGAGGGNAIRIFPKP